MVRWVQTTAALERRVLWSPEAPYRWSRFEFELIESGFTVIPTSEDGWRALVDLDNGWRQDALYPAPYVRAFPSLIGANGRRWLDRNEPPPDIAEKLVRQLSDYLGPRGFAWLCACAVYPEITWGLTLRVAGDAIDYSALPSLARLPWFRHAFMPDWLRRLLVARLPPDAGERLRVDLAGLLDDLARTSGDGRAESPPDRHCASRAGWDPSGPRHASRRAGGQPAARSRVPRIHGAGDRRPARIVGAAAAGSVVRRARRPLHGAGRSPRRGTACAASCSPVSADGSSFTTARCVVVQSCALGLVLLMVWRPVQEPVSCKP